MNGSLFIIPGARKLQVINTDWQAGDHCTVYPRVSLFEVFLLLSRGYQDRIDLLSLRCIIDFSLNYFVREWSLTLWHDGFRYS